jgi:hypothetical protein
MTENGRQSRRWGGASVTIISATNQFTSTREVKPWMT